MNSLKQEKFDQIFGIRIPPPVDEKMGKSEFAIDSILLTIWIILAFIWSAIWFTIWVVVAIPIFIVLMAICYLFEFLSRPFRREQKTSRDFSRL